MRRSSLVRLVALALIWGSSFLWIKLALRSFSPGEIVVIRLALGTLVLCAFLKARGEGVPRGAHVWAHLGVAALFANVIPFALFAYGERQVDSAVAGILNATTPLWTIVVAIAAGQEKRPSPAKLAGIVVGFAGTIVIFSPWRHASQVMSWGGLACLVAAACYGFTFVYMVRFLTGRGLSPLRLAAGQLLAGTVIAAVVLPLVGSPAPHLRADALVAVAILGAMGTGVAYRINYGLIVDEGASATSIVTYLMPIVSVGLGAVALGELIPLNVIIGMLIVLAGVALARRRVEASPKRTRPTISSS
jgi:drug/metabolite transporter (DMT)-like permease